MSVLTATPSEPSSDQKILGKNIYPYESALPNFTIVDTYTNPPVQLGVRHSKFNSRDQILMHKLLRHTDKRTDVWSRDFLIWEINFGLWAVAWAG